MTRLAVLYYRLGRGAARASSASRCCATGAIVRVMSVTMAKTDDPALRRWIHDQHDRYFSAFGDRDVVLEAFRASVSHDVSEFAAAHHRAHAADRRRATTTSRPLAAQHAAA